MHPSETQLALFAGGDLDLLDRWRVARHVRKCSTCAAVVGTFGDAKSALRAETMQMPAGVNWNRLAAEMTGNIRVGLAAGECVADVTRHERLGWKAAVVLAGATLLISTAWWLNIPHTQQRQTGVVLEVTQSGIQLKQDGAALMLLNRKTNSAPVYGSAPGSLRVRYVDSETNQVTINNVYAQ